MLFKVSIYPVGQDEAVDLLKRSGLACTFSTVGSVVEGEWDEVMVTLGEIYRTVRSKHGRVYMTISALDQSGSAFGAVSGPLDGENDPTTETESDSLGPGVG
jgi:uncharacterized protein YqgV (UPF0045/DUF77 family)